MTKYIDAEKLKSKVKELNITTKTYEEQVSFSTALLIVTELIDSLKQEQQKVDFEKELKNERAKLLEVFGPMNGEQSLAIRDFARHFYELDKNVKK